MKSSSSSSSSSTITICLILNIAFSSAAVFRSRFNDTDHPGKCVLKELNLILSPGDIVPDPHYCKRYLCYEDSELVGHTCGAIGPPPGCVLGEPLKPKAPYPDCCSREFICNNVDENLD